MEKESTPGWEDSRVEAPVDKGEMHGKFAASVFGAWSLKCEIVEKRLRKAGTVP